MAELKLRQDNLKQKQDLVDAAFQKASEKLNGLDQNEYFAVLEKMLKKTVSDGNEEVILGEKFQKEAVSFIENYNKNNNTSLKVVDSDRKFDGGFILKNGLIEMNSDFSALLRDLKEEDTLKLVEILFEN